jgi:hypothetical protein
MMSACDPHRSAITRRLPRHRYAILLLHTALRIDEIQRRPPILIAEAAPDQVLTVDRDRILIFMSLMARRMLSTSFGEATYYGSLGGGYLASVTSGFPFSTM